MPAPKIDEKKRLLAEIRRQPGTFGELEQRTSISHKNLVRWLHEYGPKGLNLVAKDEATGKWLASDAGIPQYTKDEYDVALNHSTILLDVISLKDLLRQNRNVLPYAAMEERPPADPQELELFRSHLESGYANEWSAIQKLRGWEVKYESKSRPDSEVGRIYETPFFDRLRQPYTYSPQPHTYSPIPSRKGIPRPVTGETLRGPAFKLVKIDPGEKLRKIVGAKGFREMIDTYNRAFGEIEAIRKSVEHGSPLRGTCQACPKNNVRIT
ncbi:MAG: hypothetical protein JRM99_04275 [Nitrososphaerota archaeon]|nr:hypothetical protein [Nitrososphaerota archaeon]